ncbi:tRNA epoxyqueuosine(34) reductase QueG [Geminicoccaceae bacterium 1502E]|nr:tRNA epoxyqueuosine(34) reductase QueG [Geminicoccaceae bacterium 1502E]
MPSPKNADPARLLAALRTRAREIGFDALGVTPAALPGTVAERYRQFVALERHGTMDWLAREPERRSSPQGMWPEARTAIVCAVNYAPPADPLPEMDEAEAGYISVYARNRDYHDLIKGRLKQLAGWLAARSGAQVKVFVDTAPLMEKPLAEQAGLGWQGKHTNVVSREFGSWLFLGEILTDMELPADRPETDHCGRCRRCLDACPTGAFPAPRQLDARRCISYLTIEHKEPIPRELRPLMGSRIYGCDDCLAVCPWNKFAKAGQELKLAAREDLVRPGLAELAALDDAAFRTRFAGSPIKRIGRDRFVRNVLVAIGNSGSPALLAAAEALLDDPAPVVRGAAVWACARLAGRERLTLLRGARAAAEADRDVAAEWAAALGEEIAA